MFQTQEAAYTTIMDSCNTHGTSEKCIQNFNIKS
jgi:hypothetical protein